MNRWAVEVMGVCCDYIGLFSLAVTFVLTSCIILQTRRWKASEHT